MLIPSLVHGRYGSVKSRCQAAVRALAAGKSWNEAVGVGTRVDTASAEGLLVLNGPSPTLGGTPHFHCFLPLLLVKSAMTMGELPAGAEPHVFSEALATPWGTLFLLAPANVMWVLPEERREPLLDAALRHWDVLDAEGVRYTVGSTAGQRLWEVQNNLKFVLANLGVPTEVLQSPLPPGGPAALVPG